MRSVRFIGENHRRTGNRAAAGVGHSTADAPSGALRITANYYGQANCKNGERTN
jgi:hypothetical protein